jgi:hypothetical protein
MKRGKELNFCLICSGSIGPRSTKNDAVLVTFASQGSTKRLCAPCGQTGLACWARAFSKCLRLLGVMGSGRWLFEEAQKILKGHPCSLYSSTRICDACMAEAGECGKESKRELQNEWNRMLSDDEKDVEHALSRVRDGR